MVINNKFASSNFRGNSVVPTLQLIISIFTLLIANQLVRFKISDRVKRAAPPLEKLGGDRPYAVVVDAPQGNGELLHVTA